MKIGILGAGDVGGTLGRGWVQKGHSVFFGSRNPDASELQELITQLTGKAQVGSFVDAATFAEVIVLTVPWGAVESVLHSLGNIDNKILLDCTNPNFTADPTEQHPISGGEQIAKLVPGAKVVKIFNTTGWENMADPHYGSETVTMFYAGNDDAAKMIASQLASDIGFEPIDAGTLENSGLLESLARLWGKLAYGQKLGRGIAFRLMQR